MHFVVKIDCDNDAFVNRTDMEVARILFRLAKEIRSSGCPPPSSPRKLRDINGNTVGHAETIDDDPGEETCQQCGGSGVLPWHADTLARWRVNNPSGSPCSACAGTGRNIPRES